MSLWSRLQDALLGRVTPPKTRLSSAQALERARAAAATEPLVEYLSNAFVETRDGALVWVVTTTTRGRSLEVHIDDATGDVLAVRSLGLR